MLPEFNGLNLLSQFVTFLIAVVIVWKFGWKPMVKFMNDRADKVRKTLDDAENARLSIAKIEADYHTKLQQMEQKSAELVASARQDAGRAKDEIMKAAQAEAADLRKKAHEQLAQDRRQLMGEMRTEIIGLSVAIAEKALGGPLPQGVQDKKFQEILGELSKGPRRQS
jgi:F-type H+-transporting ATPase subunit b